MPLPDYYKKHFSPYNLYPLVLEKPKHAPSVPGVYLITELFMGEEVIMYIGSSKHLRGRLIQHEVIVKMIKKGTFCRCYVIPCNKEDSKFLESKLIFSIKPLLNVHGIKKEIILKNI